MSKLHLVAASGAQVVVRAPEAGAAALLDVGSQASVRFPADAAVLVADDSPAPSPQAAAPAVEPVPFQGAPDARSPMS